MKQFRMPGGLSLLFPIFLVSGFCGLIYESIWSHYLKLFLGHAAYAQTVVLLVFIGGMAIGAWICGRFAVRIRNPLLLYAAAEFVIGWCAVAFHRVFVAATDWAYATLLPASCSAQGWCVSSWILAAALILPQSILLGTTFPLMTSGILRAFPKNPGRLVGLLYFLNSFGAVFGVLASAFVLIPAIGLPGASLAAGLLNVLLALCVYLIARHPSIPEPVQTAASDTRYATPPSLLLWVALLTGLSSFVYEIAWIRMLSLVLGSSSHAFELMLASFILGLALGGAWIRGRIDRLRDPRRFLAAVQIVMGLLAIGTIALYNASFDAMAWMLAALARTESGYVLFNVGSSLISMAIMIAPTFMAGMTLPLITFLLMRTRTGERSIGYVYAWNTLGSIAGVIFAVHIGLPQLGLKYTLASAAMIDVLLGVVLAWPARPFAGQHWRAAALASVAIALVATAMLDIDPRRTASGVFRSGTAALDKHNTVLFHRDGKTATVDVVRAADGHLYIQSNGKPDASYQPAAGAAPTPDEYTQFLLSALALAHQPQARDVAVIGFGSGISTATMLANPGVMRVDTIEIEPAMIEGARQFLPANQAAYSDPRSNIVSEDAKSYFARSGRHYDIVISEPSNPWVSGVSSLFTQEFYARLRHSINPGGLLVQWIHAYEFNEPLLASILAAVNTSFRDSVLYQTGSGSDLLLVATTGDRLGTPSSDIFRIRGLSPLLARYSLRGPDDLDRRWVAGRAAMERLLPATPPNSDYEPYVDSHAAEARFLKSQVDRIVEINRYPIPLIDLFEHHRWYAQVRASGSAARKAGASESPSQEALARQIGTDGAGVGSYADTLRAGYRLLLQECASERTTADLWDTMIELAVAVNTAWRPDRAQAFWLGAARSKCLARLPVRYTTSLKLFAAVGARDPEGMTHLGIALLSEDGLTPNLRRYAVLAALTGSLARKDAVSARQIVERWMPQLTPAQRNAPEFRGLRALAGL